MPVHRHRLKHPAASMGGIGRSGPRARLRRVILRGSASNISRSGSRPCGTRTPCGSHGYIGGCQRCGHGAGSKFGRTVFTLGIEPTSIHHRCVTDSGPARLVEATAPLGTPCATTHHTARLNDPRLRLPMLVAFSAAIAQVTVGFFALDRLAQEPGAAAQTAGIALAIVGITLVLSQSALTKLAWKPTRLIRTGAIVAAIGFGATALASTIWGLWLGFAIAAAGMGWVYPSVSALAANAVEAHEQGVAAGTITAMQGLGVVLGPIAGTLVYSMSVSAPYLMVAALLLAVGLATTATKP